ncbi:hypothetical protein N7462_002739 [Penicillium macrosclerotiorum]|uniref:uncharacterized protein n=1 Tax=Penicillium macrosclerotiorum TaxID=303699 RepID=UPI0025490FD8|nr:uncharacterized protein N7462_002739 [Penicillium macrosclerotiorum]KAJ5693316.1 hypothetical protein N7462_002739 [Penicillium macrosclerotiorum]
MPKRQRENVDFDIPPAKRQQEAGNESESHDRISSLSDELLLHILSLLPISSLNVCQRLSRRFFALGGDSELWKKQYYSQWISFSDESNESTLRPTAIAVSQLEHELEIVVGFETGRFNRYVLDLQSFQLGLHSSHVGFRDGAITAMALSSPYLLIVSQHRSLSLYNLREPSDRSEKVDGAKKLQELASLNADNIVAPMTLSLRVAASEIVATIVYSFFHIGCGWSLGIQELRFDTAGQQLESRLASTVDSQYGIRPLPNRLPLSSPSARRRRSTEDEPVNSLSSATPTMPSILHLQPPTSMSYSHPYLLTSHADNTLTMYLVVSNTNHLFVRGGQRLWGHTSSVSAVQVTNRGKAVSVSSRGDEIRIWELEMAIPSLGSHRPLKEENSIQVTPEPSEQEESILDCPSERLPNEMGNSQMAPGTSEELSRMHGCVGFDDERVLLLREKTAGTQLLECYDFT